MLQNNPVAVEAAKKYEKDMGKQMDHVSDSDILYLHRQREKLIKGLSGRLKLRPNHPRQGYWTEWMEDRISSLSSLQEEIKIRGL